MTQENAPALECASIGEVDGLPITEPQSALHSRFRAMLPIFLVLIVGSLLALSLILGKIAIGAGASPLTFLSLSMLGSGLFLWAVSFVRGQAAPVKGRVLEYGLVAGLLFLLPNAVGILAVRHVGAGFLALTMLFPLLITYCLALIIRVERFAMMRAIALLFGLAGGLLLAVSKANLGDAPLIWILLTMSAPLIIAVANLYRTLRWPHGISPVFLASQMLFGAGILLLPFALSFEGTQAVYTAMSRGVMPILAGQLATFSLLYLLYFILQKVAGPVYLSQIGSVAAVVGGAIAAFGLGEAMPPNLAISALLVAVGIILFQRGRA
ncbi:EamA/RhaT family transporter [Cohaesibacter celericrescens]|uniref:EamA/RhaT family transporter n=1 Tax=Cohaesibacter celericrescens TaxID=2067669 RepID=UPI0035699DE9